MSDPRQTQSYLRNLFARRGIAPQHRYGQNFLIDLNIHELIVSTAEVGPDDVVLEIGPGAGALTALMAGRGAAVVAVDINPGVLDNVRSALAISPGKRFKLVANLPYNIATPIVSNLLVHPDLCPTRL